MVIISKIKLLYGIKMNLSQLNKKQKAKVLKINSNDELKQRFYSFGIFKGSMIEVENVSLAKNTIEIIV